MTAARKRTTAQPVAPDAAPAPSGPPYILASLWPLAVPIDSVHEDPENARLHPDRNLGEIRASLVDHGQVTPIVADETGKVLKGNGTLRSARSLGWTSIAVVCFPGGDQRAARRYKLRDNRTSETSTWDYPVLAAEFAALKLDGFDLEQIGWKEFEAAPILLADFNPPPPNPNASPSGNEGAGNRPNGEGTGRFASFGDKQWPIVEAACARMRAEKDLPAMTLCEVLAELCRRYVG